MCYNIVTLNIIVNINFMPKIEQTTIESTVSQTLEKKSKRSFIKRHFSLILLVLVLILAGTSVYFYRKAKSDPNAATQAEVKSLISKVGKLMILPSGETPTIATVSDPEALRDQAFFVDAKKGDKVLIYSDAKKAILYTPDLDKIVNIAPLNTDTAKNPTVAPTSSSTETKSEKKN